MFSDINNETYRGEIFGDLPLATKFAEFFNAISNLVFDLVVIGNRNINNYDPFLDTFLFREIVPNNIYFSLDLFISNFY